ncbi:hypothetical protein ACFL2V_13325 [Pseudomonadota bacterium]
MPEKLTDLLSTRRTESPEKQEPTSTIGKIIKKVRDSISTALKTGTGFFASGLRKAGKLFGNRFGFSNPLFLPKDEPEEAPPKDTKPKAEENPVQTASSDLLELPTGLSFRDKGGNAVSPDNKIARVVCKNGERFSLSDNNAPNCTVNQDGTLSIKPKDGKKRVYHIDTLLAQEDGYVAHLNPDKPNSVRILASEDLELFQEAANDNAGTEAQENKGKKKKAA